MPVRCVQALRLLQVLARLLRLHEQLRRCDPEAWLEGGHDATLLQVARRHAAIVQALERRLVALAQPAGIRTKAGLAALGSTSGANL